MRKIFLTSGLVLCMACPAFADLTAPNVPSSTYPNGIVAGTESNPVTPNCTEPTLDGYNGTSTFTAIWTANTYDVTYTADGQHSTGSHTFEDAATYASSYTLKGPGAATENSGVTANTGYHITGWVGDTAAGTVYHSKTQQQRTYMLPDNNGENNTSVDPSGTITINPFDADGNLTLTAITHHNVSGAITLNSSIYANNVISGNPKYNEATVSDGITAANPTTVYSGYDHGLFPNAQRAYEGVTDIYSSANPITKPSRTGYTFDGFYNTAATPAQMIDENGVPTNAAKTEIATSGQTATWYAHWSANAHKITYTCGTKPTGASTDFTTGHTTTGSSANVEVDIDYDATYTLRADEGNCVLPGYHFVGWSCASLPGTPTLPAGEDVEHTYFAASASGTYDYDGNVTCNAVWAPNVINTVFEGGTGATVSDDAGQTCTYDGAITLPSSVTKTGYTFGGWTVTNTAASN